MAKDLPYFKFFCSEWSDGDITLEDLHVQGLFINVCAYYWSNECDLSVIKLKKKFRNAPDDAINILFSEGIIKDKDGSVFISFLDEQYNEREKQSLTNSNNAKKRWGNTDKNNKGNQLYIIHCFNENESFLKIGVTKNSISRRFSGKMPYKYEVLLSLNTDDYLKHEENLSQIVSHLVYAPKMHFAGKLESYNCESYDLINKYLSENIGLSLKKSSFASNSHCETYAKGMQYREEERREEKKRKEKKKEDDKEKFDNVYDFSILDVQEFKDVRELKNYYLSNLRLMNAVCDNRKNKIKFDDLPKRLEQFTSELESSGRFKETFNEYSKYFKNWVRKVPHIQNNKLDNKGRVIANFSNPIL